jgi:alpha-tubulin suppressor-like RCC1 family protein
LLNQFLIKAGKIFTFGDGSKGQLGHGSDLQRIKYPEQLEFFDKYRIIKAFCGECHTAFLTG